MPNYNGNRPEKRPEKLNANEFFERCKKIGLQINSAVLRSIPLAGFLFAAMPAVEKSTYGYETSSTADQEGNKRWRHEDKGTQEMIEYMSGLGPLPERYALMIYKKEVIRSYLGGKVKMLPEGWDDFTREEVEQFWLSQFTKEDLYNAPADFVLENFVKEVSDSLMHDDVEMFSFLEPNRLPDEYDGGGNLDKYRLSVTDRKVLYEKLWHLMEKCGNPKILALEEGDSIEFKLKERAYYEPATHTMYLDIGTRETVNNNFAAELTHACQHHLKPFESNYQSIIDRVSASAYAISNMVSFRDAYDELLYDKKGTIEHAAHRILEPEIKKFLNNNRRVAVNF